MKNKNKTFIIGIDGGTFDIILPLIEKGALPNLNRLMKSGAWGKLRSSIHPITPAAWTGFMTGLNPGRHGVYDFIVPNVDNYGYTLTTSLNCREETLWAYLSRQGKKVNVVNVPYTYPPENINGVMISGLDAPMVRRDISTPPDVYDDLIKEFGEYIMDWTMPVGRRFDLNDYKKSVKKAITFRKESGLYLMKKYPWDCFMLVFNPTDHVQHIFWNMGEKYRSVIYDTYCQVDESLGELLKLLDKDTTILVVSDHGAGSIDRVFYLDRWLAREGYLKNPNSNFSPQHLIVNAARKGRTILRRNLPLPLKKFLRHLMPSTREKIESMIAVSSVDWSNVRAYSAGYYGNIFINLKGRKPKGVVPQEEYDTLCKEISDKLLNLKDPKTGEPIVEKVYRKEEIYSGDCLSHAPDLIIFWKDYATYTEKGLESALKEQTRGDEGDIFASKEIKVESSDYPLTGTHRMNGIFIASGPGIKACGELENLSIYDLFPTILYAMNQPIPNDRDGRVIQEMFDSSLISAYPPRYVDKTNGSSQRDKKPARLTEEEEATVSERLRSLGYL